MKNVLLLLALITASVGYSFEPSYLETSKLKHRVSKKFKKGVKYKKCRFETRLNEEDQIEIRMGVINSPVSYFGWDAPIEMSDFPLKTGFRKVYTDFGLTKMVLTYDGTTLRFNRLKDEKVYNVLYPFEIVVDPTLTKIKSFKATMKGYDTNIFGQPKKHVVQSCIFK